MEDNALVDYAPAVHTPVVPAIQWHEGMLLSPQHFQQADLRNQQSLAYHLRQVSPYHWGVHDVKFDPIVLPTGMIRVLEVEGIMPDALIVSYRSVETEPQLEVDVTPFQSELSQRELFVYLCVPNSGEYLSPVVGEWPRYLSVDGPEVVDQNVLDNVVRIPRLVPKLSLIAAHRAPARYVSIPIAKIGFEEGAFVLLPFIAPCFQVHLTSSLGEMLSTAARRLREKAAYLSEKWQNQIGTPLVNETASLLRPLVQSLPILESIVHGGNLHPYAVYLKMCEVAGILSTLRLGQIPPVFPLYSHADIRESFVPLIDWVHLVVDSIEKSYTTFPFTPEKHQFHLHLYPEFTEGDLLVGLRAPAGMSEPELADWMRESIIATESFFESVRLRRMTGAHRKLVQGAELLELMPSRGVLIFHVEMDAEFMQSGEKLTIMNASDTADKRPSEVVLYVRGDRQSPPEKELEKDIE